MDLENKHIALAGVCAFAIFTIGFMYESYNTTQVKIEQIKLQQMIYQSAQK